MVRCLNLNSILPYLYHPMVHDENRLNFEEEQDSDSTDSSVNLLDQNSALLESSDSLRLDTSVLLPRSRYSDGFAGFAESTILSNDAVTPSVLVASEVELVRDSPGFTPIRKRPPSTSPSIVLPIPFRFLVVEPCLEIIAV